MSVETPFFNQNATQVINKILQYKGIASKLDEERFPFYYSLFVALDSKSKSNYPASFSIGYFTLIQPKLLFRKKEKCLAHLSWLELETIKYIAPSTLNLQFKSNSFTITLKDNIKNTFIARQIFYSLQAHLHQICISIPKFFNGSEPAILDTKVKKLIPRADIAINILLDSKGYEPSFFSYFSSFPKTFNSEIIPRDSDTIGKVFQTLPLIKSIHKFILSSNILLSEACTSSVAYYFNQVHNIQKIIFLKSFTENQFEQIGKSIPTSIQTLSFVSFKFNQDKLQTLSQIIKRITNTNITLEFHSSLDASEFISWVNANHGKDILYKISNIVLQTPDSIESNFVSTKLDHLTSFKLSMEITPNEIIKYLQFGKTKLTCLGFSHIHKTLAFLPNKTFKFSGIIHTFAITNTKWEVRSFIYVFKECFKYNYSDLEIDFSNTLMSDSDWEIFFNEIKDLREQEHGYITKITWNNNPVTEAFWDICFQCKRLMAIKAKYYRSINHDPLPIPYKLLQSNSLQSIVLPNSYDSEQIDEIACCLYHVKTIRLQNIDFSGFSLNPKSNTYTVLSNDLQKLQNIVSCNFTPKFKTQYELMEFESFLYKVKSARRNRLLIFWPGDKLISFGCSNMKILSMYQTIVDIKSKPFIPTPDPPPIEEPEYGIPGANETPKPFQTLFKNYNDDNTDLDSGVSPYMGLTDYLIPGTFRYYITNIQNSGIVSSPADHENESIESDCSHAWKDKPSSVQQDNNNVYAPPLKQLSCLEEFLSLTKDKTVNFT